MESEFAYFLTESGEASNLYNGDMRYAFQDLLIISEEKVSSVDVWPVCVEANVKEMEVHRKSVLRVVLRVVLCCVCCGVACDRCRIACRARNPTQHAATRNTHVHIISTSR